MSIRHSSVRITVLILVMIIIGSTFASAATGKINASRVKFRRQASTSSEIIDLLNKGTVLHVVASKGDWFKVKIGNVNGYVYSDYVTVVREVPAPAAKAVAVKPLASVAMTTSSAAFAVTTSSAAFAVTTSSSAMAVTTSSSAMAVTTSSAAVAVTTYSAAAASSPSAITAVLAGSGRADPPVSQAATVTPAGLDLSPAVAAAAKPTEKLFLVTANTLNIRGKASAEARKLGEVHRGDRVVMLDMGGTWMKIKTSGGTVGYVLGAHLDAEPAVSGSDIADKTISRGSDGSGTLDKLIRVAMSFKGVRYVYGGASRKGTDCSGFVMQAYDSIGINAPRSSISYGSAGVKIARDNLKAGDVVLFDTDGGRRTNISHVGIYLGNDRFIHASSTNRKVVVASLSGYQAKYLGARRFLR